MSPPPRYALNCSLIFQELPVLERPAAARAAGFDAIEFWWPWDDPVVSDRELDAFEAAVRDAGVDLVGLNFYGGDVLGPDAGVASIPKRAHELRDNIPLAVELGGRLGTHHFNALYGNRVDDADPAAQDEAGVMMLVEACRAAAVIHAAVVVEPLSGPKPYPLRTAADAMAIIERVRREGSVDNLGLLADFFHLANNGDNVPSALAVYGDDIRHVQIADLPGRHAPGSGELPLAAWTGQLLAGGYDGWIGLEYAPEGTSTESLDWLPREARGRKRT